MPEIIDTSVAAKWFLDEPGREAAMDVLSRVISNPRRFCVPELFYFELAHVLNRTIGKLHEPQMKLYQHVLGFGIHRFAMNPELHKLVCEYQTKGLSGYDASYVAVAKQTNGVWLTFDSKAHKKIESLGLSRLLL